MIELEELLYGEPTWEQVVEFWKTGDCCEEHYLVEAIEKHLLTKTQRKQMFDERLSVEKMLNGRYDGKQEPVVFGIYAEWNAKLGFKAFGG